MSTDESKSQAELLRELQALRAELTELKAVSAERHYLEQALRESETRYRHLVDALPDAMFVHREGMLLFVNQAAAQMVGASGPDELIGRSSWDFVHPDDHASARRRIADMLAGQAAPVVEQRFLRLDGTPVEVQVRSASVVYQGQTAVQTVARDVTNLKQLERSFRALLDAALDSILLIAPDGTILAGNQVFGQRFDRPAEELVGRNVYDLLPPEVREFRRAHCAETVRTGRPLCFEDERDGRRFEHSIYPVMDQRGEVASVAIYARDVTDQRRAEQVLRESEQRYRLLVESQDAVIFLLDREGRYAFMNARAAETLGGQPADFIGRPMVECFPPEVGAEQLELVEGVMASGQGVRLEISNVLQGRERWFIASFEPARDDAGNVTGLLGMLTDITERKRDQEALAEERNLLQTLIDALPEYIYVKDLHGRYLVLNRAMAEEQGFLAPEGFLGVSTYDLYPPELAAHYREHDQLVIESGQAVERERLIPMASGELRTHLVVKAPLRDKEGRVVGVVGGNRDITDRIRAEAERDEQRRLLRAIIDASPDHIIYRDADLVYRLCNETFLDHIGLSMDEVIGKTDFDLFSADYARITQAEDRWVLENRQTFQTERRGEGPRGDVWFEITKRPLCDEAGQASGLVLLARNITNRKKVNDELAAERNLLRTLIDALPDRIYVKDLESRYLAVNQAMARDLGFDSPDDLVGKQSMEVFPEPLATMHRQHDEQVIRSGETSCRLEPFQRIDGAMREVMTIKAPLRDADGRIIGVVGMSRDITEMRQIQNTLFEERNLLRTLIDALPDLVYVKDLEGRYLTVNQAMARELGYHSPAEIIGKRTTDIYPESLARVYCQHDEQVIAAGEPVTMEVPFQRADGARREQLAVKTPLRDANGDIVGVVGMSRDITEMKRASDALRESEEKYRLLAETTTDAILTIDLNGRVAYANPAALKLFGCAWEEAQGADIARVLPSEQVAALQQWLAKRQAGDAGYYLYETEIITRAGERIPMEVSSSLLMMEGQPMGVLIVARDIRERRRLEEQLRQSQKMETIGRLAGGVAHDFNNLLTAILGYNDFAQTALAPDDPVQRDLGEVQRAAERAARLTAQLLTFSRRQVMQFHPLNLNNLTLELGRMLRRLIGEDIELAVLPAPDLGLVNADHSQLEQVLINLAVNARDAMPRGGKLTIQTANVTVNEAWPLSGPGSVAPDLSPGDYVLLSVADTGIGMDEETLSHLFEPFFTTKEVGKGTGLGLATVYGIVKQHGGDIRARSAPHRGAVFEVYLPRLSAPSDEAGPDLPGLRDLAGLPAGHETVLLVEDETTVRATTARMLRRLGYTVWEAATGEEALRLLRDQRGRIDLLLTDVVMPRMSGRELADRVAAECPACRILFMSGYTDDAILHHGVLDQRVAFQEKPFSAADLARKVRAVLDA